MKASKPSTAKPTAHVKSSTLNRTLPSYMLEITAENPYGYEIGTTANVERATALDLLDNNQARLFHINI